MKLLLILGDDDTHKLITHYIKPLGFELIRYTHVLKAMDSIDEISPNAIIISARDFPRHWKIMVQFVRSERDKDACPIIILKGKNFPVEEASKASFLEVNGIVAEAMENPAEIGRLQVILSRHLEVNEKRQALRFHAESWQKFGFVFTRPNDHVLITGEVKNISIGGLSFLPENESLLKDMTLNTELEECSLRAGDSILSPVCRLIRMDRIISMAFISLSEYEQETLNNYIDSIPFHELEDIKENQADTTP